MHFRRHVIALVATAIAFAFSFVMLQQALGPTSAWLGLVLMFFFLGLAKIAEPLFTLPLPAALRAIRPREIDGAAHDVLGSRNSAGCCGRRRFAISILTCTWRGNGRASPRPVA